MNNLIKVNDDILKDWFDIREEVLFDKLSKQNKKYVKKQPNLLDKNFVDYICYWNEKYYENGFIDGVQLIDGCIE